MHKIKQMQEGKNMLVIGKSFLQTPLTGSSESLAPSLPIYSDLGREELASDCGPARVCPRLRGSGHHGPGGADKESYTPAQTAPLPTRAPCLSMVLGAGGLRLRAVSCQVLTSSGVRGKDMSKSHCPSLPSPNYPSRGQCANWLQEQSL